MCRQWREVTGGGDLCHQLENGHSVGEEMCRALAEREIDNLPPHEVSIVQEVLVAPVHLSCYSVDQSNIV